jgi:leucyl-tRNA synthetase
MRRISRRSCGRSSATRRRSRSSRGRPWDPKALEVDEVEIAVQVMGKLRGTIKMPKAADKDAILKTAKETPNVAKWLEGQTIVKEVVVPGRLVNFVVRS